MYVDETGDHAMGRSSDPNHRFLGLTGVVIDLAHVQDRVHPDLEKLKTQFFNSHPDNPAIFHRKDMVNGKGRFRSLRTPETEIAFNQSLLHLFRMWEYHVITVCLDKQLHGETYADLHPYHHCLAILTERFIRWLDARGAQGDVLAESRGGKEDRLLKDSFRDLWESGTTAIAHEEFEKVLTSRELKLKKKEANIAGLQLADLLAHPTRCDILNEQELLGRPMPTFATQIIQTLNEKSGHADPAMYEKIFT